MEKELEIFQGFFSGKKKYATLGCVHPTCKKGYHLPCGISNGSLQQFFGSFASYCAQHRPVQAILAKDGKKRKPAKKKEQVESSLVLDSSCGVCLEDLEEKPSPAVLWSPCCGGWFHRYFQLPFFSFYIAARPKRKSLNYIIFSGLV